jgi:hypothetical protein
MGRYEVKGLRVHQGLRAANASSPGAPLGGGIDVLPGRRLWNTLGEDGPRSARGSVRRKITHDALRRGSTRPRISNRAVVVGAVIERRSCVRDRRTSPCPPAPARLSSPWRQGSPDAVDSGQLASGFWHRPPDAPR